ncbi:MAG: threonylcarbamoyl-AMP synthase [Myxococcales bacterium FL481]|nr:MAG: threonylcarbamoyl-AMP synthase [Myxococcales bacterium FL481]
MRTRVDPERPAPRHLKAAVQALVRGEVIVYPSDTGYAFGCLPQSSKGVATLRKLKRIDERHRKPLSMLVGDLGDFGRYGQMSNAAFRVIRRLLPGPYTIVLKATSDVPRAVRNRDHELGLRIPDHAVCRMLVELLEGPLLIGSVTSSDAEPELEEPDDIARRSGSSVTHVLDAGYLWPEPSTVLRFVDDDMDVVRVGQGPVPS